MTTAPRTPDLMSHWPGPGTCFAHYLISRAGSPCPVCGAHLPRNNPASISGDGSFGTACSCVQGEFLSPEATPPTRRGWVITNAKANGPDLPGA